MASGAGLTYHLRVESPDRARGKARLAPLPDRVRCRHDGQSTAVVAANGQNATEAWIEASNEMGGPDHVIPPRARRLVLDAA